jgi:PRC-barrel domain
MACVVSCLCLSVQAGRAQESKKPASLDTPGPRPKAAAGSQEEPRSPSAPDVQEPVRRSQFLRSSKIIGASVAPRDGAAFGRLVELVIGDTGRIEYAVVQNGRRWTAIPWAAATFDLGSRTLRIDLPRNRIAELPTFASMREFGNAQFQQRVQAFFRGNSQAGDAEPPSPRRGEQRSEQDANRDPQAPPPSKPEPAPKPQISSSSGTPAPQPEKPPAPAKTDAKKSDKSPSQDAKAAPASKQEQPAKPKTSSSPAPQPEKPPAPAKTDAKKSDKSASQDAKTAPASKQEQAAKPKTGSSPGNTDVKKSDKGASQDAKSAPASKPEQPAKPKTGNNPGPQPQKPPAPTNTDAKK